MIILDIETSGLNPCKNGICEIGAIDLETSEEFLQECRIDNEDEIDDNALDVNGRTIESIRDVNKQSQKNMIENFLKWIDNKNEKIYLGQNVGWDITFLQVKAFNYGLKQDFLRLIKQKIIDLHTISQLKYLELNNKFFLDDIGKSNMGLKNILEFCGMNDFRGAHNALEDCKLTGECFYRLIHGKNLFNDYSNFKIPNYLKKEKENVNL